MDPEGKFWELAEPLMLTRAGVTRSMMMGFPCLRVNGGFFASFDRKHEQLVVKLPAARVAELVTAGAALPFSPAGRTFREWAAIPAPGSEHWPDLLDEALAFVALSGGSRSHTASPYSGL